jgi:hypothetical protein
MPTPALIPRPSAPRDASFCTLRYLCKEIDAFIEHQLQLFNDYL